MKKILLSIATAILFTSQVTSADTINIFTWDGYLSEEVASDFTKKTGHKLNFHYYDNEMVRDVLIMKGKADVYDLILIDGYLINTYHATGKIQAFDNSKFRNADNYEPEAHQMCHNGDSVPYSTGSTGIAYRKSVSKTPITSWQQLFVPPKEHEKGIVMIKDEGVTVELAMLAQGLSPFNNEKSSLREAHRMLKKQRDESLLTYGYGVTHAMQSKDMTMTVAYSSDLEAIASATGQDDWEFVIPSEGTMLWIDCWGAPGNHSIKDATYEFLDYLNDPAVSAKNSEDIWFRPTTLGIESHVDEEFLTDKTLYPDLSKVKSKFYYAEGKISNTSVRNRILLSLGE